MIDASNEPWLKTVVRTHGLIFSPVRVEAETLKCVLTSIERSQLVSGVFDCAFYDDNIEGESSEVLKEYTKVHPNWKILPVVDNLPMSAYDRGNKVAAWQSTTVDRVIFIKNSGLSYAAEQGYDWVFLLDSDTIIHPRLIETLLRTECDIVSGICWTRFRPEQPLLPNCWDYQTYGFRSAESLIRLREPGLYEVGGLAAATLIRSSALARGVSFSRIPNLDMWGEDRHFCVRAVCLGLKLHVETTYPVFHVYTPGDLEAGRRWLAGGCRPEEIRNQLDERWESDVRRMLVKRERPPEGSVRRRVAGALRRISQVLDPK